MNRRRQRWGVAWAATGVLGLLALTGWLAVQMALAQRQPPTPQAILVLEGQTSRVRRGAELAQQHPALPVWVSGNPAGQPLNAAIFRQAGVAADRIHYDHCATDTVTNFTCTVADLAERRIHHVYLVTSDYHMERSRAIAAVVFGSRGIVVTPVAIAAPDRRPESPLRTLRDILRSLVWLATGKTGASLNPHSAAPGRWLA
jgi:uncharacterized SAM-binding protein YcdF (DUF218 family)